MRNQYTSNDGFLNNLRIRDSREAKLSQGSENIRLVDDEDMILDVSRAMLGKLGYRVAHLAIETMDGLRIHFGPVESDAIRVETVK